MSNEIKGFVWTPGECMKRVPIGYVCDRCGGNLEPVETVDNSGNPTYWPGCMKCYVFCYGVSPRIFAIAQEMVVRHNLTPYSTELSKIERDDADAVRHYMESQIGGACRIVSDILEIAERSKP